MSTAYTNSNQRGYNFIEEKVYDLPNKQDPEEAVAKILALGP